MNTHQLKYLLDIDESIRHIEIFTSELTGFSDYENDLLIKRAVERELEIIGEAMSNLLILQTDIKITDGRRIVDLRNRIIHGYASVDDGVIWGVLKRHLPLLKIEVHTLPGKK